MRWTICKKQLSGYEDSNKGVRYHLPWKMRLIAGEHFTIWSLVSILVLVMSWCTWVYLLFACIALLVIRSGGMEFRYSFDSVHSIRSKIHYGLPKVTCSKLTKATISLIFISLSSNNQHSFPHLKSNNFPWISFFLSFCVFFLFLCSCFCLSFVRSFCLSVFPSICVSAFLSFS